MDKELLDLYTDYLISSFSYTTATGLSSMLHGAISHDKITRFLAREEYTSKELWLLTKKFVREIESEEGVLTFDDTIEEKEYTDENDIICWHFDHSDGRSKKGINLLSLLYNTKDVHIPIGFEVVKKTECYTDPKSKKRKRKSKKTKNEMFREMLLAAHKNHLIYRFVLADIWYSSNDNMEYITKYLSKDFIFGIKSNRLVSLSKQEKLEGKFTTISDLNVQEGETKEIWLKGLDFPVLLIRQVFTNKDNSEGILYLVCSDLTMNYSDIASTYQRRWSIEEYHKSIKSNTGLSRSPTRTEVTQNNHFFGSIYAYVKLEVLKVKTNMNHFKIKSTLYIKAIQAAHKELNMIRCVT